jgi:hypothetical protein
LSLRHFGEQTCPGVEVVRTGREDAEPARVRPCVLPWLGACCVVRFSFGDERGVGHRTTTRPSSPFVGTFASAQAPSLPSREVAVGHVSPTVRLPVSV